MKKLNALLAADPELIYELLDKVKTELKAMLPFEASNSENFNKLYYSIRAQDVAALNFPSSLSWFDRAKIIAKTDFKHFFELPYVAAFVNGMGVCSELNFLALMVLSREYDFVARLETIHSDQTHTYIVLTDSNYKEYVLDAWSGAALAHDNDLEWNEVMPFQYARKMDYKLSVDSCWTAHYLRSLWPQLEAPDVLRAKKEYYDSVVDKVSRSMAPRFFAPVASTSSFSTVSASSTLVTSGSVAMHEAKKTSSLDVEMEFKI